MTAPTASGLRPEKESHHVPLPRPPHCLADWADSSRHRNRDQRRRLPVRPGPRRLLPGAYLTGPAGSPRRHRLGGRLYVRRARHRSRPRGDRQVKAAPRRDSGAAHRRRPGRGVAGRPALLRSRRIHQAAAGLHASGRDHVHPQPAAHPGSDQVIGNRTDCPRHALARCRSPIDLMENARSPIIRCESVVATGSAGRRCRAPAAACYAE